MEGDVDLVVPPEFWDTWAKVPVHPVPNDVGEWMDLALETRTRALLEFGKIFVAGSVYCTRLQRDSITTVRLMTFDDSNEEFQRMAAGTLHPQGRAGPCPCGSGETYARCCLAPRMDKPCDCKSGETLRECCSIGSGAAAMA